MANIGRGAVAVIGHGVHDDGDAGGAVAFVGNSFVVVGRAAAERLFNGALDVVVRHIGRLRLGDDRGETGVVRRIAASAFLNGNDHFTGDLGERLCALGVLGAFGFLYVMPLGMSGHAVIPPNKNTFKEIIALSLPDDKGVPYLPCGIRIRSPGFTGPGLADSISSRVEPNFFATVQSDSSPSRITIRDGRSVSSAVSPSSSSI